MAFIRNLVIRWANDKRMYCRKCGKDTNFKRSVWDGSWVCQNPRGVFGQKCGYSVKE